MLSLVKNALKSSLSFIVLVVKKNGGMGVGLKERGGLINFMLLKGGLIGAGVYLRGGLNRGFTICLLT